MCQRLVTPNFRSAVTFTPGSYALDCVRGQQLLGVSTHCRTVEGEHHHLTGIAGPCDGGQEESADLVPSKTCIQRPWVTLLASIP